MLGRFFQISAGWGGMPMVTNIATKLLDHATFDRRVAIKAAASFAAMASTAAILRPGLVAAEGVTTSLTWTEADHPEITPDADGWITFSLEQAFSAIAPTWAGDGDPNALVQLSLSADGVAWTNVITVGAAVHDAGQPDRDNRYFADLTFADSASWLSYRALDSEGNLTTLPDLAFTAIDSRSGPLTADAVGADPTGEGVWEPPVISRAMWGADESLRFDKNGDELWPPSYQEVEHIIIHHTETANWQDPMIAVRAVYYYHAVERGWGDIGYNYLVDYMGNVYEGRAGGENVVGGHAYQYAWGSSGVGVLGSFSAEETTPEAQAGVVWITAWLAQGLDPWGTADFHEQTDLPTICGHRDVNDSACPGEGLYGQLDSIRSQVAAVLDGANPVVTSAFYPGDTVRVVVEGANLRTGPGTAFDVSTTLAWGTVLGVTDPAVSQDGYAWYGVWGDAGWGWCAGVMMELVADATVSADGLAVGDEVVVATDMLNLRSDAGRTGDVVARLPNGTAGTITGGPIRADGFVWHEISSDYGDGWTAGNYLAARGSGAIFAIGDEVVVDTDAVWLRSGPGTTRTRLAEIPGGAKLTITETLVPNEGHDWYGVHSADYGDGWTVAVYLAPA
jgi:uncharacterized protein YgiM (DUF1202 family)